MTFFHWLVLVVAILLAAYLVPGVHVTLVGAIVLAVVLGLVNVFVKPIIALLTLPINILTLGISWLVINALIIMLLGLIAPGFGVSGFWAAFFFSIILAHQRTLPSRHEQISVVPDSRHTVPSENFRGIVRAALVFEMARFHSKYIPKEGEMNNVIIEGKTKKIIDLGENRVRVLSKDDITAGDGAKHDILANKATLSTTTTSNVFELLRYCGLPVAFCEQDSLTSFIAPNCRMLPWEVVVRRRAKGSILKRKPEA